MSLHCAQFNNLIIFIFRGYDHQIANQALPGELYAEVLYQCDAGFKLSEDKVDRLFCSEGDWIGRRPKCVEVQVKDPRPVCPINLAAKCDQLCFMDVHGRPLCECHPGKFIVSCRGVVQQGGPDSSYYWGGPAKGGGGS